MVDITDTHNTRGRLDNEWAKLFGDTEQDIDPAPIDDRDRRAIETFVQHRRDIEEMSRNTLINDLGNLRRAAERADTPLVDMDIRDARGFISELVRPKEQGGYGLDPDGGGIYNYKRALRVFFTWLDEEPGYGDYGFSENLELPSMSTETIDDDDVLTEHEIEDLKDAANSARDRALVDFLADVGARISLVTSLRVGDIKDIESDNPGFVPNDNAINLKGVEIRRYPILYSRGELRVWLNQFHPDPHPEAPLWPKHGYDPENRKQGAVSNDAIRDRLNDMEQWSGVDKRVHPHNFRHVFMTRIASADLSDREIKHMSMLTDNQLRMLERYDHTSDQERTAGIQEKFGFLDPDEHSDEAGQQVELVNCPNCLTETKSTAHFCPQCGWTISKSARDRYEEFADRADDSMIEADTREQRMRVRRAKSLVDDDRSRLSGE